jgi:hypothetical protein
MPVLQHCSYSIMGCIRDGGRKTITTKKVPDELSKDLLKWFEEEDPFGINEEINMLTFTCKDR